MLAIPKPAPQVKVQRLSIKNWMKGYISALDDGRMPNEGLKKTTNVVITQNGTVRPMPSLAKYGVQPIGEVIGWDEVTRMESGRPVNYIITAQVVGGVGKIYMAKDGGNWIACSGASYATTAKTRFCQINEKVLVSNGIDNLSLVDLNTFAIAVFVAIPTPTGVTATQTGMAGTNYTYRYKVTALRNGETAASTVSVVQTSEIRDAWNPSSQFVNITWNRVPGAARYYIYCGSEAGYEYELDVVTDSGSGATQTYKDNGAIALNINRLAPISDTTAGIKATMIRNISGQVFAIGDPDNPYRVSFGGTVGDSTLDFSPFNGGGWIDVNRGSKELPVAVVSYRTGKGDPSPTVLFKSTNGNGSLKHLISASETIGETVITFMQVIEANGMDGTDSPDGVILAQDSLWYPSRDGFKTTGTKPSIQNILSTNRVSDTIADDVMLLNINAMNGAVGVYNQGRLYWTLPVGGNENTQIWHMDLTRNGLWCLPWLVPAKDLLVYGSSDGQTRFLALVENKIMEFSYAQATTIDGVGFNTTVGSGIIKFSPDGMEWARVIAVNFVFLRPQGNISISITGRTEESSEKILSNVKFATKTSIGGWGESVWGSLGWGDSEYSKVSKNEMRVTKRIEVDEDLNWLQWQVDSTGTGVDYQLSDVVIEYVPIGMIEQ